MRIAVDVMGGDHAPEEIIKGALEAANNSAAHIILVGDTEIIENKTRNAKGTDNISIYHSDEVIEMDESPSAAIKKKKNSSMVVAHKLLKEEKADAVVSAGNTGAQMAAALLTLGRVPSISRPAIVTALPTLKGPILLLDVGANMDCKPENLLGFAQMGSVYAKEILGYESPKVGLLNIGKEETKGNMLTQTSYPLLKDNLKNFYGNIEARDIFDGDVEVIVCDGFVGNNLLKFAEGLAEAIFTMIKNELQKNMFTKTAAYTLKPGFKNIKNKLDYEEYGGAPLLGVNGISIICHGSSKAYAITNAVKVAGQCIEIDLLSKISTIEKSGSKER